MGNIGVKRVAWLTAQDMTEWDSFVENHPLGWISHLSAWREVLERSFGHIKGYFLVLRDSDSDRIIAGLPLYAVRSWLLGNRLVSVPFITHNEALISTPEHMKRLFPHILELHNKTRASCIQLNAWRSIPLIRIPQLHASHFYKHHWLPLDRSLEEIKQKFHKSSIRRKIGRAMKSGIGLRLGEGEKDVRRFHRMFLEMRRRLGLPPVPYRFFRSLWEIFGATKHMVVLFAVHEGRPVAGYILFKFGQMATSEFACDVKEFRSLGVNQFCEWEAIKMAHGEGFKIYSFGRTSPLNTGLMASKDRWGAEVDNLPSLFFPGQFAERCERFESTWRYRCVSKLAAKAPRFLSRTIGSFVYQHMG